MADPYRVGISIALANGVSPVLHTIANDFLGLGTSIRRIEGNFRGWATAIGGTVAILGGMGMLGALKKVADASKDLLDQQDQLMRSGISHVETLKLTADGYDRVAKLVPTAAASEYLKTIKEVQAVTGQTPEGLAEAQRLAPKALMVDALLSNTFGTKMHGEYYKLLRSEEMKGIATDEAKREAFTNSAFGYITAFGGKLKADDIVQLARRGGTSFMNMKPEAFGPTAVIAADLGGSGAGTAGMTLQQLQLGANTLTKQQAAQLESLGLLDMSKTTKTGFGGGRLQLDPGAMKGSQEYAGDIPGWVQNVVWPAIMEASKGDPALAQSLLSKIAPNRNAAKMIQMYGDEGFQNQIAKDLGLAGNVKSIEDAYKSFTTTNPKGVEEAYNSQYKSMMEAIGSPLMQAAMPIMKAVTEMFSAIGAFANSNPGAIKEIATGLGILGVALTGGGIAALLAMLGPTGWFTAGIIAATAGSWELARGLNAGIDALVGAFGRAAAELAKLAGMFGGLFKGPGDAVPPDTSGGMWKPTMFNPGTSQPKATQTAFSLNIDGRVLAQNVIEQMESLTEHATSGPNYNAQSHFARADSGMAAV
jgi:hypothetical protein